MKAEALRNYAQGAVGSLIVAVIVAIGLAVWSHYWVDQWQSAELWRLRTQLVEEQKVQAEVVKWINGVVQAQQQQRPAAAPATPAK